MKSIVIIHVTKKYEDIADLFVELLKKNWEDCPYEIIVSYKGMKFKDYGFESYVSSMDSTLPKDIYDIMSKYQADYCFSFLGDAFITSKICNNYIERLLMLMENKSIDYCRLFNTTYNEKLLCPIPLSERYGVSFIAFIVSKNFVEKEFSNNESDIDFEVKYLKISNPLSKKCFKHMYALPNGVFSIVHGIAKGIWIKQAYEQLCDYYGKELSTKRGKQTTFQSVVYDTRVNLRKYKLVLIIQKLLGG